MKNSISPPILLPKLPTSWIVPSVQWLGLIWLLWLGGTITFPLLAISWNWSWIELLLLVSAYSCLMVASYTYVMRYRNKLLSQYQQQIAEYRLQFSKYQKQLNSIPPLQTQTEELIDYKCRCQLLANLMLKRVSPIG
ncbi:MAG: hypothetical protein F6K32_15175, partial [Desertifilum sp. SIO1I2]|nr:hypothetical protein [Desertifilum sp. SIO1I2]